MMTTIQPSEIDLNLNLSPCVVEPGITGEKAPAATKNEVRNEGGKFSERLKKVMAELKWLKEALSTLVWLKTVLDWLRALLVSVFGLGFFYCSSTAVRPLADELFPQAEAGRQFVWSHPDYAVKAEFDSGCAKPRLTNAFGLIGASSGLRLRYGLTPAMEDGGWGVHWDQAPARRLDASTYDYFSFWVRGDHGDESFEVGLKDTQGRETRVESRDWIASSDLKHGVKVIIPLAAFKEVDRQSLNNVNFSFNSLHGSGTLCIDNMEFGGKNHRA